jgi:Cdc6-like AAA superfamily ATPase
VTLICTDIDADAVFATGDLDTRTRSRLRSFVMLQLSPYTTPELVDILEYRVAHGLDPARVSDEALHTIATAADGDGRVAVALLRQAAYEALASETTIDAGLVETVTTEARAALHLHQTESLNSHEQTLYRIIHAASEEGIEASELHTQYEQQVQNPRNERTRRRYLATLKEYGLIEWTGTGRGRRYRIASERRRDA